MEFKILTKNNVNPKGKSRVYFTCHPDDMKYLEHIKEDIWKFQDCVIYYTEDMTSDLGEMRETDLNQMNLFVIPVTWKLLSTQNRAMNEDFIFAYEHHIPVLPIMEERGLYEVFSEKFNSMQYLSTYKSDFIEIPYEEKLKRFLESVLDIYETKSEAYQIAGVYDDMGKYEEALNLYEEVKEARERILGSYHPDTLSTKNSMARINDKTIFTYSKNYGDRKKTIEFRLGNLAKTNEQFDIAVCSAFKGDYLPVVHTLIGAFMVLILSKDSIRSPWVQREVSSAIGSQHIIIPYQIEQLELNNQFKFMMNCAQILHAWKKNDNNFQLLVDEVKNKLTLQNGG